MDLCSRAPDPDAVAARVPVEELPRYILGSFLDVFVHDFPLLLFKDIYCTLFAALYVWRSSYIGILYWCN